MEDDGFGEIKGAFTWKLIKSPRANEQSKLGLTAVEYFTATYDKTTRKLVIKGSRKDDPHSIIGLDIYHLTLSENGEVLEGITANHGTWKGVFYGIRSLPKKDKLEDKQQLQGRKIITTKEVTVRQPEVILQFWDDRKEDGDIISLNLNGEWILRKYIVKKTKGEIVLDLIEGDNYLILHAENLGELPPNTAAISVIENGVETATLILNSDMGKSEGIKIVKE